MLIRVDQLTALNEAELASFEERLLGHIRRFFPVHWREIGEVCLRKTVRLGTQRAAEHGLETQRDIYLFVSLMLRFGSYFDTDDQLMAVRAVLVAPGVKAYDRIGSAYDAGMEFLGRIGGPDAEIEQQAIRRFIQSLREPAPTALKSVSDFLSWMYPEKAAELDHDQLFRFAVKAMVKSNKKYALDERGPNLYAGLGFLLGHQFVSDPQFPWIAEILNDPRPTPNARTNALVTAASDHLAKWVES